MISFSTTVVLAAAVDLARKSLRVSGKPDGGDSRDLDAMGALDRALSLSRAGFDGEVQEILAQTWAIGSDLPPMGLAPGYGRGIIDLGLWRPGTGDRGVDDRARARSRVYVDDLMRLSLLFNRTAGTAGAL